jgi:PKD domain
MAAAVSLAAAGALQDSKDGKDTKDVKKPSVALRVAPPIAFSPARVVITAELRGGAVDDPDLYCPEVEWDWGDGTKSEATENCEPFEAGKSTIKRRWTTTHTFQTQGMYRVQLRLKRGPRTIASGNNTVQVKAGARDLSDNPY